jgi:hypothetical protein
MAEEQRFPRLSDEQKERLGEVFRDLAEEGNLQPKLHESLIGLDTNTYQGISFPDIHQKRSHFPPSELLSFAYDGTDAYATALLSTDTLLAPRCTMTVTCELRRVGNSEDLTIRYASSTDILIPELWGPRMAAFLNVFSPALATKAIHPASPIFCDKVGAPVWFAYPGKLRLSQSVLAELPQEKWPRATRRFVITDELRDRARNAAFLLTAHATRFHTG